MVFNSNKHDELFTKDFLIYQTITLNKSNKQIAKENHCSQFTLRVYLKRFGLYTRSNKKHPRLIGEISGSYWNLVRYRARIKKHEFALNKQYMWELFLKQNRKCALSGLELILPITYDEFNSHQWTASIDRIDSDKGYVEGNVQWVHKHINIMKWNFSEKIFLEYCRLIVKNAKHSEDLCNEFAA